MAIPHSTDPPFLPQEILDLIVDEVARLKPILDSRAALRTCALVSKAFAYRSRKHLWDDFVFSVDASYRVRVNKLVRMLRREENESLVSHVRSIQLVFDAPLPGEERRHHYPYLKGLFRKAIMRTLQKCFKPRHTSIFEILQMANNPNLQHFTVVPRNGRTNHIHFAPDKLSRIMKPGLLLILSSTSIKSFALCNIGSISRQLVAATFFSAALEDLTMRNLHFGMDQTTAVVQHALELADLKRLEMINVPIILLISLILDLLPSSSDALSSLSFPAASEMEVRPFFPRLQTLVVTVPYSEDMLMLWKFVLGGATYLENLELEYHYRRYGIPQLNHLSLRRLTSLQNFKFRTVSPDVIVWVEASQRVLLNIFTFPCFSTKLKTIELQFLFSAAWDSGDYISGKALDRLREAAHWPTIDGLFVSDEFLNLEVLKLSVEVRHYLDKDDITHRIPAKEMQAAVEIMFPRVTGTPRIKVVLDGRIVFCSNPIV